MNNPTDAEGSQEATEASVPGTWPDGEPNTVRDMARRGDLAQRADDLAARLESDLDGVRDVDLATAVRAAIESMGAVSTACREADEDSIYRAAKDAHEALTRCAELTGAIERRGAQ